MKLPSLKLVLLALAANLAPLATGVVQILLGNVLVGVGTIAGAVGTATVQVVNAEQEQKQTRSLLTFRWFFSRLYVWLVFILGVAISFMLLAKTL